MPAPYIGTPHTNDISSLTNGFDLLDDLSPEKSFAAPPQNGDLLNQMRIARKDGMNLKTPRVGGRDPLRLLPNGNQGRAEFTPLLKSVAKTNMSRRISGRRKSGVPNTPALSTMDESHLRSEHNSSSIAIGNDFTPIPHNISSSAASTPLGQVPKRDGSPVLNDGNMMTLREQETIIDKIEKENFGLKMKIHFLEEALSKRGNEFNQAALKENTDLKVNRITMQRELHKFKKTIAQAERDAELYRQQLEEYRERVRRKQADETFRLEMESIKSEIKSKDAEIVEWKAKYDSICGNKNSETEKMRDELEDLRAEVRDKDRQLEERDDEIDSLKLKASKGSHASAELAEELDDVRQKFDELKQEFDRALQDVKEAKEEQEEAEMEKRRAEQDLDELRDEMANKSFTTKGLSRQIEEKAHRLEDEYHELQERYDSMKAELEEKLQAEKKLQERLRDIEREGSSDLRQLQQSFEESRQLCETTERKNNSMVKQIESLEKDLQIKTDEKDLLQSRHDALTEESADLQKDINKMQKTLQGLEALLEEEKQKSAQNDNYLRNQHRNEIDVLNDQIDNMHREMNTKDIDRAAELEKWEAQRRNLEAASLRAEEKATGLQRTVDKLQDVQGTLSGRELKLQEALGSEHQRHLQEEKVLSRQIEELNSDLAAKRVASDENRAELNNAKEELRISIREQAILKEKVAELEDEIEVLQADIEQEHEFVQKLQQNSAHSSESQVTKLRKEKQDLQESLASVRLELESTKKAIMAVEADRDDLEAKLEKAMQPSNDDTFDMQQEKRELRRVKQTLEKDLDKIRAERDNLAQVNKDLEEEINAEIDRANVEENRLNSELDELRKKQINSTESRDRELKSAKSKVSRLETRVQELEESIENQSRRVTSPGADASMLRRDLAEARKNESAATKREFDLKNSNRDLKMKVNDLERDLHEVRLAQLKSRSPSTSPPQSHSKELFQARSELVDARLELKGLQSENRDLKHRSQKVFLADRDNVDLQSKLKLKSTEAEDLAQKLRDCDDLIGDLRKQLKQIHEERKMQHDSTRMTDDQLNRMQHLRTENKRLRTERDELRGHSVKLSVRDKEATALKDQLKRLREERSFAHQKAEAVEQELDILQSRYEGVLEKLTSGKGGKDDIRGKEMKGLLKEIMWLKAKCRREERLRKDLAWSKGYLERNEVMRAQCNQVDLRILREMGVQIDSKRYTKPLRPIQKFRAGVFAVIAAIRMSNMEEQWRDARQIGEQLQLMRKEQGKSSYSSLPRMREI